ncbi:MAG: methylated-DNA--[protein]-cysteine S-methyltransferase [Pseudomonadota bacterium]
MNKSAQEYQAIVHAPFGSVGIIMANGFLVNIDLLASRPKSISGGAGPVAGVVTMIQHYLQNPAASLKTKLKIEGTEFQNKVWKRLQQIPMGKTQTYGQLAEELNSSARAIGNACRSNPCPLVIPCHRVVGKSGLGGFSGQRSGPKLEIKRWLLMHEGWL